MVILAIVTAAGIQYGRKQSRRRAVALNELALTEQLLGDVQVRGVYVLQLFFEFALSALGSQPSYHPLTSFFCCTLQVEKDRFAHENDLMEQAWKIRVFDLHFGDVIGEGSYGSVFKGSWGYITLDTSFIKPSRLSADSIL